MDPIEEPDRSFSTDAGEYLVDPDVSENDASSVLANQDRSETPDSHHTFEFREPEDVNIDLNDEESKLRDLVEMRDKREQTHFIEFNRLTQGQRAFNEDKVWRGKKVSSKEEQREADEHFAQHALVVDGLHNDLEVLNNAISERQASLHQGKRMAQESSNSAPVTRRRKSEIGDLEIQIEAMVLTTSEEGVATKTSDDVKSDATNRPAFQKTTVDATLAFQRNMENASHNNEGRVSPTRTAAELRARKQRTGELMEQFDDPLTKPFVRSRNSSGAGANAQVKPGKKVISPTPEFVSLIANECEQDQDLTLDETQEDIVTGNAQAAGPGLPMQDPNVIETEDVVQSTSSGQQLPRFQHEDDLNNGGMSSKPLFQARKVPIYESPVSQPKPHVYYSHAKAPSAAQTKTPLTGNQPLPKSGGVPVGNTQSGGQRVPAGPGMPRARAATSQPQPSGRGATRSSTHGHVPNPGSHQSQPGPSSFKVPMGPGMPQARAATSQPPPPGGGTTRSSVPLHNPGQGAPNSGAPHGQPDPHGQGQPQQGAVPNWQFQHEEPDQTHDYSGVHPGAHGQPLGLTYVDQRKVDPSHSAQAQAIFPERMNMPNTRRQSRRLKRTRRIWKRISRHGRQC